MTLTFSYLDQNDIEVQFTTDENCLVTKLGNIYMDLNMHGVKDFILFFYNIHNSSWQVLKCPSNNDYRIDLEKLLNDQSYILRSTFGLLRKPQRSLEKVESYPMKMSTGESLNLLIYEKSYSLCIPVLIWVTITRRFNASYNTIRSDIYRLRKFYNYCADVNVQIDDLIVHAKQDEIIDAFNSYCLFLRLENNTNNTLNSPISINGSMQSLKQFFDWICIYYFKGPKESFIGRLSDIFSNNKMKTKTDYNNFKSLEDQEIKLLEPYITPNTDLNPFSKPQQLRNFLIFIILLETGARIGELLKIKTLDIIDSVDKYFINYCSHTNDVTDERAGELGFKTLERGVEISRELYECIEDYIDFCRRPKNGNKVTHLYLFTNYKGVSLSQSTIYTVFKKLRSSSGLKELHPHMLRHTFSVNYLKYVVEIENKSLDQALCSLRYLGGWSNNSDTPLRYSNRYIAETGNSFNSKRIVNAWLRTQYVET